MSDGTPSGPSADGWLPGLNRHLEVLTSSLTAGTAALFFAILIAAIGLRSIHRPLSASEELGSLLFVWSCFGGATLCFRRDQHIKLQFLTTRWSAAVQHAARTAGRWLIMVFLVVTWISSIHMTLLLRDTHMPISGLPQWLLYLPISVFSLIMILFNLEAVLTPTASSTRGRPRPTGPIIGAE